MMTHEEGKKKLEARLEEYSKLIPDSKHPYLEYLRQLLVKYRRE